MGKDVAFAVTALLTSTFCVVELVFSIRLASLALIADAFHNISDVVSIVVAWHAHRTSQRKKSVDDAYTFAYRRSELLGGFFNLSSLCSLCLFVVLEAIPRFITPPSVADLTNQYSVEFMGIAAAGVGMNLICALIFGVAGIAAHGGHSHGHGHGHGHAHNDAAHGDAVINESSRLIAGGDGAAAPKRRLDVNVLALLIHMVGDVLSSLVVLAMGLVIYFEPKATWTAYVDPAASLLIVAIILATTIPAFSRITGVLMQKSPIQPAALQRELQRVGGVQQIHELHVWSLVDGTNIGTAHVVCANNAAAQVRADMRGVFHRFGVHSVTVQTEPAAGAEDEFAAVVAGVGGGGGASCQAHCVDGCEAAKCCE